MRKLEEITEADFVIDMNNGFCEKGKLADPSIKRIVPNIRKVIMNTLIRKNGGLFIINDCHTKKSVELTRENGYGSHCITPEERKTIKELAIFEKYATNVFYKNSTCGIFAPGVMETLLKMRNIKKIIITGCCTDICIMNFTLALRNFMDEWNVDVKIEVPINAVDTYHIPKIHEKEEANQFGFEVMNRNGIRLVREMN